MTGYRRLSPFVEQTQDRSDLQKWVSEIIRRLALTTLARTLSVQLCRPVLDNTQLCSHYDLTLQWPTAPDSSEPAILNAVPEQFGLKLKPQLTPN
jgi:uncharacterized protein (TIGR03435 family)